MNLPAITLVTPCFNHGEFLEQTIRSVLDQNYPNLQYIIIDGGSTDNSVAIIERYIDRLTYWISEPDLGQSHAINKGFAKADGEIMAWLNSDDLLLPGALHAIGESFARYPQIAWLTGQPVNISVQGKLITRPLAVGHFRRLIEGGWYHGRGLGFIRQESTYWRRSLWEQTGGALNVCLHYSMDFELWRRFSAHADLVTIDRRLAAFRLHPAQKTHFMSHYYEEAAIPLPPVARPIALPLRAVFTWLSWPFAPHVVNGRFHPGPFFRSGISA